MSKPRVVATMDETTLKQFESWSEWVAGQSKPLVLTDAHRQQLERALGRNLDTPNALVVAVEHALSLRIDNIAVPLSPHLLDRLRQRALSTPFDRFLPMTIKRLLEEFAGLR